MTTALKNEMANNISDAKFEAAKKLFACLEAFGESGMPSASWAIVEQWHSSVCLVAGADVRYEFDAAVSPPMFSMVWQRPANPANELIVTVYDDGTVSIQDISEMVAV